MIVISGALVLVALVLLVVGLTMEDLPFVYGSIGTSLLAFVFLVVGILQRRGEQAPAPAAGPAPGGAPEAAPSLEKTQPVPVAAGNVPVDVSKRPAPTRPVEVEPEIDDDEPDDELLEEGGLVLVVAGRPRYHVDGCRYLTGKDVEEIDVLDARDEGFTPCGVCRPDEVITAELEDARLEDDEFEDDELEDDELEDDELEEELEDDELEEELEDDEPEPEPEPAPVPARPARRGSRVLEPAATRTLDTQAPVKPAKAPAARATAAKAAKAPAPAGRAAPTGGSAPLLVPGSRSSAARGVPAAAKAPSARAAAPTTSPAKAAAAASTPAAATAARRGTVVVIPDRGKFHRAECRYVRDAADALELSKASATKQGFDACGVCKP